MALARTARGFRTKTLHCLISRIATHRTVRCCAPGGRNRHTISTAAVRYAIVLVAMNLRKILLGRAAFAGALLIRPAMMFGPDDALLTTVIKLLKRLPIFPMFGRGRTRLQPAYVEDVAEAVAMALQPTLARPITFECGGPHVYSYEELLRAVAHEADIQPILIPTPLAAWDALAWIAEFLPGLPITRNQVELMQVDNVSSPQMPGFADLGISPHSIEQILQEMLRQP
jgi:nucleoside-diphosphate-sugar epimerase